MSYRSESCAWGASQHESHAVDNYQWDMSPAFESSPVDMNFQAIGGGLEPNLLHQGTYGLKSLWSDESPWIPPSSCGLAPVPAISHNFGPHRSREASVTTASAAGHDLGMSTASIYSGHEGPATFPPADAGSGLEDEFAGMDYNDPSETGRSQGKRLRSASVPEASELNGTQSSNAPRRNKRPKKASAKVTQDQFPFRCEEIVTMDDGREGPCDYSARIESDLKKHQDKHRKPHKCRQSGCGKGFTTSSDLDRHKWSIHNIPHANGSNGYYCPLPPCCETVDEKGKRKKFSRKDNFKQHIAHSHPDADTNVIVKRAQFKHRAEIKHNQFPMHFNSVVDLATSSLRQSRLVSQGYFESRIPAHMQCPLYSFEERPQHSHYYGHSSGDTSLSTARAMVGSSDQSVPVNNCKSYTYGSLERSSTSDTSSYNCTNPSWASSCTSQSIHNEHQKTVKAKSVIVEPPSVAPPRQQRLEANQSLTLPRTRGDYISHTSAIPLEPQSYCTYAPNLSPDVCTSCLGTERQVPQQEMAGSCCNSMHDAPRQEQAFFQQAHQIPNQHMVFPKACPDLVWKPKAVIYEDPQPSQRNPAPSTKQVPRSVPGHKGRRSKPDLILCKFKGCKSHFKAKSVYQKHAIRHERLFACTFGECPTKKRFGSKSDWKRHELKQDAERIKVAAGGDFWCGFCGKDIPIDQDTLNAGDDRFNHIGKHFLPERTPITKWKLRDGRIMVETKEGAKQNVRETGNRVADPASDRSSESTDETHETSSSQEDDEDSDSELPLYDDAEGDMDEDTEMTGQLSDSNVALRTDYREFHRSPRIEDRNQTLIGAASAEEESQAESKQQPTALASFSCCACGTYYSLNGTQVRCMGLNTGDCNHMFCGYCPGFLQSHAEMNIWE